MAIYIEITKHYETHEKVAYLYSCDHISWGEFLITKESFALESVKELKGEKQKFLYVQSLGQSQENILSHGRISPGNMLRRLKSELFFHAFTILALRLYHMAMAATTNASSSKNDQCNKKLSHHG